MKIISELFTSFFQITIIGIGILFIPILYKLLIQIKKREPLVSMINLVLIGVIFILAWLIVGIASSMWIGFFVSPSGGTTQLLVAHTLQSVWIFVGLILSVSKRATLGAIYGAFWGLLNAIQVGGVVGFVFGFVVGILFPSAYSHSIYEKIVDGFAIGIFGAIFLSLCMAIFVSAFTTLGGAIIGFLADTFGKVLLYERLLKRFKINSKYST